MHSPSRQSNDRAIACTLTALGLLASCTAETEQEGHDDRVDAFELRAAVYASDDPVDQTVLDDIAEILPEHVDATSARPELFPAGFEPDLQIVSPDTEVWLTFVTEGAGQKNALGFFTYPEGNPPTTALTPDELEDGLIFNNASKVGSGGSLYNGARMLLGEFQPGTRIGFYLVKNGYCTSPGVGSCDADVSVNFNKPVFYSIDALNPESAANRRHVVQAMLLNDTSGDDARLLSFEDLNRDAASTDHDFNDVVFRVTATPDLGDGGSPSVPLLPVCGNGLVEDGEDCDDGNASNNDDCYDDCTIPAHCNLDPSLCTDVHRVWTPHGQHFYTTDSAEGDAVGSIEALGYFTLNNVSTPQLRPFYRCDHPDGIHYLYTSSATCEVWGAGAFDSRMGYIAKIQLPGTRPLYRLFNHSNADHIYVTSVVEKNHLVGIGWKLEGTVGYVW